MRELVEAVPEWLAEGRRVAVAAVLETWGSAPRRPGALMAVADDGRMAGSVSGGCVEAAVVVAARAALDAAASIPSRRLDFDVADDDALAVGLACGGRLAVQVAAWPRAAWERLLGRWAAREPIEIVWLAPGDPEDADGAGGAEAWFVERPARDGATVAVAAAACAAAGGGGASDRAGAPRAAIDEPRRAALAAALAALAPVPGPLATTAAGRALRGHRHVIPPPPRVVIIGGGHLGAALARVADALGWEAVLVDPREAFARPERFPASTRLVRGWPGPALALDPPDAATAVVAVSHDPRIDEGALGVALAGDAFYVGALGGRRTAAARRARLADAGLPAAALLRLRAPIGLAIGAATPEEIAVAVGAELVAAWRAGPGREAHAGAPAPGAPDAPSARGASAP